MDTLTRRRMLVSALLGGGYVGLRSMVSGIPLSVLQSGLVPEARAEELAESITPHFLILCTSGDGDPINANCPGSYGVEGVYNNPHDALKPVEVALGDTISRAAAPWATLPKWARDRMTFIHHRTYQNAHPQYPKVMALVGNLKSTQGNGTDHLSALISHENAKALGTIQSEQVSLGGGRVSFQGRSIQSLRPQLLREMLAPGHASSLKLQRMRDETLDALHTRLKQGGTPAQKAWLDRHALSRQQTRRIDEHLLERFSSLDDDSPRNQALAAVTLIMMKVSPVITMHIPFGGDNHGDRDLMQERDETLSGISTLSLLFEELREAGLEDHTTVANFGVFGRTLNRRKNGNGRDHNLNHHVMMICGPRVRPGVIGSIMPIGKDFGATGIDSLTGAGALQGADIPADQTLESAARTLATCLGVSSYAQDERIQGGKLIQAVVRT